MTTSDPGSTPPCKRPSSKKPIDKITIRDFDAERGFRVEAAEGREERRSRLAIEEARASHKIWRDKAVLICSLGAVPVLVVACLLVLFLPGGSTETRTSASSTQTGIATGVVGYSLGQRGKTS